MGRMVPGVTLPVLMVDMVTTVRNTVTLTVEFHTDVIEQPVSVREDAKLVGKAKHATHNVMRVSLD